MMHIPSIACTYIVAFFTLIPKAYADSVFETLLLVKSTVKHQKSKKKQIFFLLSLIFQISAEMVSFLEYMFFYLYATTPESFIIPY